MQYCEPLFVMVCPVAQQIAIKHVAFSRSYRVNRDKTFNGLPFWGTRFGGVISKWLGLERVLSDFWRGNYLGTELAPSFAQWGWFIPPASTQACHLLSRQDHSEDPRSGQSAQYQRDEEKKTKKPNSTIDEEDLNQKTYCHALVQVPVFS